jgi:hypothetical protein
MKFDKKYDEPIFNHIFLNKLKSINKKNCIGIEHLLNHKKESKLINKKDKIKIENTIKLIKNENFKNIIEFIILEQFKLLQKSLYKNNSYFNTPKFNLAIYNLHHIYNNYKDKINTVIYKILHYCLTKRFIQMNINVILKNIGMFIEHNEILNCKKKQLFNHQKQIFKIFKQYDTNSKFIFYCSQTSSGKTLTPIGLSNAYKIVFMCASKHVGLSLAKTAFNMKKKIGFAFGCNDISHIRINFNAINSYIENNGKKIPDHNDGRLVEIMITDVKSFEYAMLYMKSFNPLENIILFWDEPTIGLDVEKHELHDIISYNWKINQIPNIVFSCATLPKLNKMTKLCNSFKDKFDKPHIEYIESYDQNTNLCLYDNFGNIIMPHRLDYSLEQIKEIMQYHEKKYFKFYSCEECSKFILHYSIYDKSYIHNHFNDKQIFDSYFIKSLYFDLIMQFNEDTWKPFIQSYNDTYPLNTNIENNIFGPEITTKDAFTLTNGPTLYITNNIEKLCKFFIAKSNINEGMINDIYNHIEYNNNIFYKLNKKEKEYQDKIAKFKDNENIMANMRLPEEALTLEREIEKMKNSIYELKIDNIYKPNTRDHFNKWCNKNNIDYQDCNPFTSNIDYDFISNILSLQCLNKIYKFMALLGIGIFSNNIIQNKDNTHFFNEEFTQSENEKYIEFIKELAETKSLYLIIANSDYIYGTNYQFSHCYLGKDMENISQEKIIQCIGRIGRQVINKHFSFRFRSTKNIYTLYSVPDNNNIEIININNLFC